MESQDIRALQSRLDRLEARNRLLACALLTLAGLISLFLILSAVAPTAVSDVVRARSFEVVDASGEVRAKLGIHPDGSPTLRLCDTSGEIRAELCTRADGATWLSLLDANAQTRAALGTDADGSPGLWLHDASGNVLFSAP